MTSTLSMLHRQQLKQRTKTNKWQKVKTRFCSSNFLFLDTSFAATIFALQNHFGFHFDKGKKKKLFYFTFFHLLKAQKWGENILAHKLPLSAIFFDCSVCAFKRLEPLARLSSCRIKLRNGNKTNILKPTIL